VVILTAIVSGADMRRRHPTNASGCTATLAECFQRGATKEFQENEQIEKDEFEDL
jgi:hypothetical protein